MEGLKENSHEAVGEIARKGFVITAVTLVSRPLGYIREAIQAYLFGATFLVDAFVISFNFPELIQTLFFSGATSAFLIPVCTKYIRNEKEYSLIYSTFINLCLLITFLLSIFLLITSSGLIRLIAPGFEEEPQRIARNLFIMMIPIIPMHALLSVIKAFLNAKEHFLAPELSGVLWNITFILFALFLSNKIGIYSLAMGVSVGSVLQVLIQIPFLRKMRIQYSGSMVLKHPATNEAKRLFTGAFIATSVVPINSFLGRVIASFLPEGEVASLSYAFRLFILPFSLFAVPVYTVIFSRISKFYHERNIKEIFAHIDGTLILLSITLIPSSILLCSAGNIFIKILYERGAFLERDTILTYRALFGYSVGLFFYGLSICFVRIFNAFHDVKTPAIVGLTSILLNFILAFLLMKPLGNLGISLATSLVSLYNFSFLFIVFKKKKSYKVSRKTIEEIIKSLISGLVLAFFLFFLKSLDINTYIIATASILFTFFLYATIFKSYYQGLVKKN